LRLRQVLSALCASTFLDQTVFAFVSLVIALGSFDKFGASWMCGDSSQRAGGRKRPHSIEIVPAR
jgi:hypothetical protein